MGGSVVRVGLLLIALSSPAIADTVVIGPVRDTSLYAENAARSNGAGQHVFTGITDDDFERRALLAFDVANAIPAGSTITAVSLTLRLTRTRAQNVAVALHPVREAWGEAGSDAPGEEGTGTQAQTGDATWSHRIYPATTWTSPGGFYVTAASATTIVGKDLIDYTWSTPSMIGDVQSWLSTPAGNHGWIVIAPSAGIKETKRFASRTHADAAQRPRLTVTFTTSTPAGACCATDGGCTIVPNPGTTCTGTYQGNNTTCSPNTCPQPAGACCMPDATAACTSTSQTTCAGNGGVFQGLGTVCPLTACPVVLTPFVDPLPIPAVAQPVSGTAGGAASYEMRIVQLTRTLHSALPPTTLWGFDDGTGASSPGPTIEARSGQPINMVWRNDLRDNGVLRTTHFLPIDACITTDTSPRTVIHLHGGHVPADSDGYPEATLLPAQQTTYSYPNQQPAATLWYHDHAMGITRLNVLMGLAGFYNLRDAAEDALGLPSGANEIPLVIQDRSFDPSGHLRYPAAWEPHFFGDTLLVNGVVWPYLQVRRGKYRFRVLDGSSSRSYTLALSNGATFHVIGTDGGLLSAPVARTSITLMPGERADIVIDFASYPAGTELVLVNSAPAPFPGPAGEGVVPNVLKFIVTADPGHLTALPASLVPIAALDPATAVVSRDLVLKKRNDDCTGEAWTIDGLGWNDITERPTLGTTEIWRFLNASGVAHPMHLHLVQFQIIDRQPFVLVEGMPIPTGAAVPPPAHEAGWKDTVQVGTSEMVRVIARFEDYTGKFAYHCHMLEHEDWDMMRQFEVINPIVVDGAPDAGMPDAFVPPDDAPDAALDGGSDAPGNGGGPDGVPDSAGGGCCQTSNDRPPLAHLLVVALALLRRRRRPK